MFCDNYVIITQYLILKSIIMDNIITLSSEDSAKINVYMSKVYSWMTAALAVSALTAWQAASSSAYMNLIAAKPMIFYGMLIAELVLVIFLSARIHAMSLTSAIVSFLAYSVITGLTLSTIFLVYTPASIAKTFIISAGVFGTMSLYGYVTKRDLTSWAGFLFMSLIGIIIASVVNMFLHSFMIDWIVTYAGVIIFIGLAAYDTQKLKHIGATGLEGDMLGKMAIMGALTLYLDLINLFLFLLRIFGRRD